MGNNASAQSEDQYHRKKRGNHLGPPSFSANSRSKSVDRRSNGSPNIHISAADSSLGGDHGSSNQGASALRRSRSTGGIVNTPTPTDSRIQAGSRNPFLTVTVLVI